MTHRYRKESDEAPDTLLAGLYQEERQKVRQMQSMIEQLDSDQLMQLIAPFEENLTQAPPENQDMVEVVLEMVRERLEAEGAGGR